MRFLLALMAMTLFAVSVGCEKPAETTETEKTTPAAPAADVAATTDAAATGETKTVSLKLPKMTWGGCEKAVVTALTGIGATNVETNCGEKSCSFEAPADFDVEAKLGEIAKGTKLEGWSVE